MLWNQMRWCSLQHFKFLFSSLDRDAYVLMRVVYHSVDCVILFFADGKIVIFFHILLKFFSFIFFYHIIRMRNKKQPNQTLHLTANFHKIAYFHHVSYPKRVLEMHFYDISTKITILFLASRFMVWHTHRCRFFIRSFNYELIEVESTVSVMGCVFFQLFVRSDCCLYVYKKDDI